MDDNIDNLIESLKQLKQVKSEDEHKKNKVVDSFRKKIQMFNNHSQNVLNKLQELENEISKIENDNADVLEQMKEDQKKPKKQNSIKYKKFKARESVLTKFLKNNDYQTLYNIFMTILLTIIGNFLLTAYINEREVFNVQLYYQLFSGWSAVAMQDFVLLLISLVFVVVINTLHVNGVNTKTMSIIFITLLTISVYLVSKVIALDEISFLCKILIVSDKLRTVAKLIAYYLEKVYRITYYSYPGEKQRVEGRQVIVIKDDGLHNKDIAFEFRPLNLNKELLNFTYFFFSPTLIYRDLYPMNKKKNLKVIMIHIINIALCFIFIYIIFYIYLIPYFNDTSLSFIESNNILQTLVNFIVVSMMCLFVVFFGFSHSLLNLSAEVLGFADKKFYKAFWNSSTPNEFYKKLMLNFYDFFRYYAILVTESHFGKISTLVIKLFLFCGSIEVIFYNVLGYFYPITTFLILGCHVGTRVMKPIKSESMIMVNWWLISFGSGMMMLVSLTGFYIKNSHDFSKYQLAGRLFGILTFGST
jgi:hypothetical protein